MRIATAQEGHQTYAGDSIREGKSYSRCLVTGDPKSLANYNTILSRMESVWEAPRHKHNFEQIRLLLEGEVRYGKEKVLNAGEVAYFPEGVPYGPQVRKPGSVLLHIQFGGASRNGYLGADEIAAASKELKKKGQFENGVYTYYDERGGKHNQDGFEACWEHHMGRPIEYPKPRYADIVLISPQHFDWVTEKGAPGVEVKYLGTFTERETRLDFVRVASGATLNAGNPRAGELLFLMKGAVTADDASKSYGAHTAFGLDPNEGPVPLRALEESEFFRLRLPALEG